MKYWIAIATLVFAATANAADRLKVGHNAWIGYSAAILAREKGFFQAEDLEVVSAAYPDSRSALSALAKGKVDVAFASLHDVARMAGQGDHDVVAIFLLDASHGASAVVGNRGARTLADLRGARIAVAKNGMDHLLLNAAMARAGLERGDVDLIDMPPEAAGAALLAGEVDAAVTRGVWVGKARSAGSKVLFSSAEIPNLFLDAVVVRKSSLGTMGPALAKLLRGIDDGQRYLATHAPEAHETIGRWLRKRPADVARLLAHDRILGLDDNVALMGTPDAPGPAIEALEQVADFVVTRGFATDPIEASTLLSGALVAAEDVLSDVETAAEDSVIVAPGDTRAMLDGASGALRRVTFR